MTPKYPPRAHVLIIDGQKRPFRALREARAAARKQIDAWLLLYPDAQEKGTYPQKRVGPRFLEIVSVHGEGARRVWAAWARQEPCQWCHDVGWVWAYCDAGTQRRVCGTCSHPSYDCYCGREQCHG